MKIVTVLFFVDEIYETISYFLALFFFTGHDFAALRKISARSQKHSDLKSFKAEISDTRLLCHDLFGAPISAFHCGCFCHKTTSHTRIKLFGEFAEMFYSHVLLSFTISIVVL